MEFLNELKKNDDIFIIQKFDKITYLNRKALSYLGMWPLERDASKWQIILRKIHHFIIFFLTFFILCIQWFDMYSLWGNLDANAETFLTNAYIFTSTIKLRKFIKYMDAFKDLFSTMRKNWMSTMKQSNSKNKEIMYNLTTESCRFSTIYWLITISVVLLYLIMPVIPFERDDTRDRRYPLFGRYYFDKNSDVIYGLCYASQFMIFSLLTLMRIMMKDTVHESAIITGLLVAVINYSVDAIFLVCIYHFSAQICILQNDLKNLGEEGATIKKETIINVIRRHQIEIRNAYEVDMIFSGLSFQQILTSCSIICVTGFKLIVAMNNHSIESLMYIMCVPLTFVQILFYCYPGNELVLQSQLIGNAIYESSWINLDQQLIKNLIFMIQRSQKPLSITAGKIYVLSLENFMKIIKASVSALSMLQAMYRQKNNSL